MDMKLSYDNQGEFSKKLFIETYGCQMNVADSEVVASVMKMAGYDTTFTEVSGRESCISFWNHPCSKVWNEGQTFQCHNACRHQITGREERVLQICCHRLFTFGNGCKVLHLNTEHYIQE